MRTGTGGSWLAMGLLLGCGLGPSEVVGVYEGQGSTSTGGSSGGTRGGGDVTAGTGPIADGSAGSGTGMPQSTTDEGDTTHAVDPSTTDPGTTSLSPPESTSTGPDPGSTSDLPGESSSDGEMPPPSCDDLFGLAVGYELCFEDDVQCGFDVDMLGNSCATICGSFGAACLGAIDNPGAGGCTENGPEGCDIVHGTEICICAK
jgi:hypothetical protein